MSEFVMKMLSVSEKAKALSRESIDSLNAVLRPERTDPAMESTAQPASQDVGAAAIAQAAQNMRSACEPPPKKPSDQAVHDHFMRCGDMFLATWRAQRDCNPD